MPTITVTEANLGNVIASEGVLSDIKMLTAPTNYTDDYFCLTDPAHIKPIFNMHISTSFVSDGSLLMSGGTTLFKDLTLSAIPPGSSFEIETITAEDITPVLSSLTPNSAVSGSGDFALTCNGSKFTGETIINFAGHDEPTTFGDATKIGTLVKPSLFAPATVPVYVYTASLKSGTIDFTFEAPPDPEPPDPEE